MIEERKIIEQKHYNKKVYNESEIDFSINFSSISIKDKVNFPSILYYYQLLNKELLKKGKGTILDFGCGTGNEHYKYCSEKFQLIGIDISEKSIEIANQNAVKFQLNAKYLLMDCENLRFPKSTFDIVLDSGTLSSLDINKAIPEILKVIKPDGSLICIETLGNNLFMNFKRKLNVLMGKRTKWAAHHILKMKDWKIISQKFEISEITYYSFTTLFLITIVR